MRAQRLVGRAHRGRARVVLGLPAPRQPPARPSTPTTSCCSASRPPTTPSRSSRSSPTQADRETDGTRWSYCRDLGRTRLVVDRLARRPRARGGPALDARRGRVGVARASTRPGDFDHLLIATSLPWLLGRGMHYLEAWSEAVAGGAWGGRSARVGERCAGRWTSSTGRPSRSPSRAWPSSCARWRPASAARAPASVVVLSGDVHHAYLFEVAFPRGVGRSSRASARRSARRTATRSSSNERRVDPARACRDRSRRVDAGAGALRRGRATRPCAGAWSATGPGSTTRSPRCGSTAARSRCAWRRRCRGQRPPLASSGCSIASSPETATPRPPACSGQSYEPQNTHSSVRACSRGRAARRRDRRSGEDRRADRLDHVHALQPGDTSSCRTNGVAVAPVGGRRPPKAPATSSRSPPASATPRPSIGLLAHKGGLKFTKGERSAVVRRFVAVRVKTRRGASGAGPRPEGRLRPAARGARALRPATTGGS